MNENLSLIDFESILLYFIENIGLDSSDLYAYKASLDFFFMRNNVA